MQYQMLMVEFSMAAYRSERLHTIRGAFQDKEARK